MFGGFTSGDFDAYAAHKWRSNAYSRERLEVKQKLLALGREIGAEALAADGSELAREASTEHPALWNQKKVDAQHLFFSRGEEERSELDRIIERGRGLASLIEDPSPQRSHVFLSISIAESRLRTGLRLHADAAVDRENLESKLREEQLRADFLAMLARLPEEFTVAVEDGHAEPTPARTTTSDAVNTLLGALARPLGPGQSRWLAVTRDYAREAAVALGAGIAEHVRADLAALLPVYHFVAWSRDNDHIGLGARLRSEARARRQRGLAKNDRVRIVTGMFTGRAGLVQEVDAKGGLKVLVGKIPVVLKTDDVEKL